MTQPYPEGNQMTDVGSARTPITVEAINLSGSRPGNTLVEIAFYDTSGELYMFGVTATNEDARKISCGENVAVSFSGAGRPSTIYVGENSYDISYEIT